MDSTSSLPALLGGPPVRPQGPPAWPIPDEDVLHALQEAYHGGAWGKYQGGYVERLEERLIRYHDAAFAVACASGTFAVELALRALKIGPGDEVILAAYDYPGNFLSIHALGARPVLIDVAPGNWNLEPARLSAAVGPATRGVIASHLHGGVVPMRAMMEFCVGLGLKVIEDAAQAPGALVQGRKAGTWGDVGILSFGGSKLLSAGRGGAILTQHPDIAQRARLWLNRGNVVCPLSELQAAVLLPQLDKLDARNAQRSRAVQLLREGLRDVPGIQPFDNGDVDTTPGYYKVGFRYDPAGFGLPRELFIAALQAEGIAFNEGFRALHVGRSPSRFRQGGDLTEAAKAHHGTVILHHPVLLGNPAEVEEVAWVIRKIHVNSVRIRTVRG